MAKATPDVMQWVGATNKLGEWLFENPQILQQFDEAKDSKGNWYDAELFRQNIGLPRIESADDKDKLIEYASVFFEKILHWPMPDYSMPRGKFTIERNADG